MASSPFSSSFLHISFFSHLNLATLCLPRRSYLPPNIMSSPVDSMEGSFDNNMDDPFGIKNMDDSSDDNMHDSSDNKVDDEPDNMDDSSDASSTTRAELKPERQGCCVCTRPGDPVIVGCYIPDHESDKNLRRAVSIVFDHVGHGVYSLERRSLEGKTPWPADNSLSNPERVFPRDIEWIDEFNVSDKHERLRRIYVKVHRMGMGYSWGWSSYRHMVNDPGFRLEHERRTWVLQNGVYWAPTFRGGPYTTKSDMSDRQYFVRCTLDQLEKMMKEVKEIVAGIDLESEDFVVRQKTCQKLFTTVRRGADMLAWKMDNYRQMSNEVCKCEVDEGF